MDALNDLDDGRYTAVVDSIEDGLATIFFERDGEEVDDAIINARRLPDDGRHADAVFTVDVAGAEIVQMDYIPEEAETRKQDAQDRFDRLSSRPPREDDST